MSEDFPTFSEVGEENIRGYLKRKSAKVMKESKPQMCIYYYGTGLTTEERYADVSGDGDCLATCQIVGDEAKPCRETIAAGRCIKKRTKPQVEYHASSCSM